MAQWCRAAPVSSPPVVTSVPVFMRCAPCIGMSVQTQPEGDMRDMSPSLCPRTWQLWVHVLAGARPTLISREACALAGGAGEILRALLPVGWCDSCAGIRGGCRAGAGGRDVLGPLITRVTPNQRLPRTALYVAFSN